MTIKTDGPFFYTAHRTTLPAGYSPRKRWTGAVYRKETGCQLWLGEYRHSIADAIDDAAAWVRQHHSCSQ